MSVTDMTKGNPAKLILRFAFPIIITNLGQQFYMITDAAIVGRGVGVEALAAIGCTDWTYWVVLWSVSAMTQGFATFIARYFGQQNYKMMNRSLAMSIILSLAIALLFTGLGIALAKPILSLLETPKAILFDAVTYLTTITESDRLRNGYIHEGVLIAKEGLHERKMDMCERVSSGDDIVRVHKDIFCREGRQTEDKTMCG